MSKNLVFFLTYILFLPALAQELSIVTEQYPPYNYQENGKVVGVSTEVIQAVLSELDIEADISVLPWSRALDKAKREENVLIYSISRIPEREIHYKWVGVIASIDFYLFALEERKDIIITKLNDAKNYHIAVALGDAQEHFFSRHNFPNLHRVPSHEQAMKMLIKGRIDLWPISDFSGYYFLDKNNYASDRIRKVYKINDESDAVYMAFGAKTSDEVVEKFRTALEKIKKNGIYDQILKKHSN